MSEQPSPERQLRAALIAFGHPPHRIADYREADREALQAVLDDQEQLIQQLRDGKKNDQGEIQEHVHVPGMVDTPQPTLGARLQFAEALRRYIQSRE